jgi:acetyl esterase/lipase
MKAGVIVSSPLLILAVLLCPSPAAAPAKGEASAAKSSGKVYTYKKTPQGELQIEFFFPPGWQATDPRPAIVFFFGGAWRVGERKQFYPQSEYFASRGIVAATADYRIQTKHNTTPDKCVEDAKSAIRWVKAHAKELGVDPQRVIAGGGSAGGHLAAATALCPGLDAADDDLSVSPKPVALVLFNPALNLTSERILSKTPNLTEEKKKMAAIISPNRYLTKDAPPAIIFFGTEDALGEGGREYFNLSAKLKNRAELYLAPGQKHGFFNRSPWTEATLFLADEFLASLGYLQGKPTIQVAPEAQLKKAEPPK